MKLQMPVPPEGHYWSVWRCWDNHDCVDVRLKDKDNETVDDRRVTVSHLETEADFDFEIHRAALRIIVDYNRRSNQLFWLKKYTKESS